MLTLLLLLLCTSAGVITTELGRHFEKTMSPMMKKLLPAAFTWAFKSIPQVTTYAPLHFILLTAFI
jgi:nitrate reductase gamma subunit